MSFSKVILSNSTNGQLIKVTATSTPGTNIHVAGAGTTQFDEIWLWAQNNGTVDSQLTLEWGSTTAPDNNIKVTIPTAGGLILTVPGMVLNNGGTVSAFAALGSIISLGGYVNRGP